eukprot:351168-Chlamydomonas_euryale.AAC.7
MRARPHLPKDPRHRPGRVSDALRKACQCAARVGPLLRGQLRANARREALCLALYGCTYMDLHRKFGSLTEMGRVWLMTWQSGASTDQLTPHVQAAMGALTSECLAGASARLPCWTDPQPVLPVAVTSEDAQHAVRGLAATVRWRPDPAPRHAVQ